MATQGRDDSGRFTEKISDQLVLKAMDFSEDEMLTTKDIAGTLRSEFDIDVTNEAVRQRLSRMERDELVSRKDFGARAVGWRAEVAPRLSPETADRVETARLEVEQGETVALEDA